MKNLLYLLAFSTLIACSPSEKKEDSTEKGPDKPDVQELKNEVMAIHDTAMFYMQDIENLRQQLLTLQDSLKKAEDPIIAENIENQFDQALVQLSDAEEEMMDWMRTYTPAYREMKKSTTDSLRQFLEKEKEKIKEVKKEMEQAMEQAKSVAGE